MTDAIQLELQWTISVQPDRILAILQRRMGKDLSFYMCEASGDIP